MAGRELTAAEWAARRSAHAPPVLRERVLAHAARAPGGLPAPEALAAAARAALADVEAHAGDRSAALDLLAADALITLALLAQAEREPARLREFAAALLAGRAAA